MDKLIKLFFLWLLAFCAILIALWLSNSPNIATGMTDTIFTTLQKSGESVTALPTAKWLAYLYGIGIIGIFSFVVLLGANKANDTIKSQIYKALFVGIALYFLVYTAMVWSWWDYTLSNSMDYFLGLPKPTAWMFALMLIPIIISSCYIFKFHDWIYTKEEEERFQAILAKRKLKRDK